MLPRLLGQVVSPGALAVQMPAHFRSPIHELMIETARNPAWHAHMDEAIHAIKVERPAFYYDLLQHRASKLELWETEYVHVMDSPASILEWIRGTALRPFLEALPSELQQRRFEELFLARLTSAYPAQKDGRVLFPFRRIFILAYR